MYVSTWQEAIEIILLTKLFRFSQRPICSTAHQRLEYFFLVDEKVSVNLDSYSADEPWRWLGFIPDRQADVSGISVDNAVTATIWEI